MKNTQDNSELTIDSVYNTVIKYGPLTEGIEVYNHIKENPRLIEVHLLDRIRDACSREQKHQYIMFRSEKMAVSFEYYTNQSIENIVVQGGRPFDAEIFQPFQPSDSTYFIHKPWRDLAYQIGDEQHVDFQPFEDDTLRKEYTNYVFKSYSSTIDTVSDLRKNIDNVLKAQETLNTIILKETKRLEKKSELKKEVQRLRNL